MFHSFQYNGGEFLKSDLIPFSHAFSTRTGGVSSLPHLASMNVALNRGDDEANVHENRRILMRAAGAEGGLVYASQVHSADIAHVETGREIPPLGLSLGSLDGVVSSDPSLTLLVKVADCAPILLCDPETGLAAAIHAGWRSTAAGIAAEGVHVMAAHGANLADIRAAIGPCIHACCFEVGEDLRDAVISLHGADFASRHIREWEGKLHQERSLHADITAMNVELLLESGILLPNIDICPLCTCCEPDRFFSHRATKGQRGTMGAVIQPRAAAGIIGLRQ